MFHNTGDQEAQMLAQIKSLPEGDMKNSLLDSFLKAVRTTQRARSIESSKREPLFIDASFDKNTKTFIKFNKEAKLQNTSVTDLAKEVIFIKKEVTELKGKIKKMEEEAEYSFKIDSWARKEIAEIKERLDSILPPLEDVPIQNPNIVAPNTTAYMQGLTAMKIMPIKLQKYQVKIKMEINGEVFYFHALIDIGSDMNLIQKNLVPIKYWLPSNYSAIGLGNVNTDMFFEIPKGILLFDEYALGMKFLLTDLPVDCILGTPFLSAVEPHGSYQSPKGRPGYFITLPSLNGRPSKRKQLPFISEEHAQIAYCFHSMIIING